MRFLITGLAAGLVNGLLGVGGGTVLVPALTLLHRVPDKDAHGTTLAVILPTSIVSALIYARGGFLDWGLALRLTLGGVVGSFLGARLLPRLSDTALRRIFSALLIVAGLQLLFRR